MQFLTNKKDLEYEHYSSYFKAYSISKILFKRLIFVATLNRTDILMFFHNLVEPSRRIFFVRIQDCMVNQFLSLSFYDQTVISVYIEQLLDFFPLVLYLHEYDSYGIYLFMTKYFSV